MRERAFAVLGPRVAHARFLDLFSGTGAVGFEALSRGAAAAVLVERHRNAAQLIEANRASLGVEATRARLLIAPVARALRDLEREGVRFDLAWADPPFESWGEGLEALLEAFAMGVISAAGTACLECPARAVVEPGELVVERDLVGGASRVVLLRRRASTVVP
jgi:16S rRNA (guanine(966)-N(2))-methyltransferase RsmD